MNVFYLPLQPDILKSFLKGLERRFQSEAELIVFNSIDAAKLSEDVKNVKVLNLDYSQEFDCETQFKLATVLHNKFYDQHGLSMKGAIILAHDLLKMAMQCCLAKIVFEDKEQTWISNAPKHVEDCLKYLPEATAFVETRTISSGDPNAIKIIILNIASNWQMQQVKELMEFPNANLVLCGVNLNMSDEIWNTLDDVHPLFRYKQLLDQLKISRTEVCSWHESDSVSRSSILSKLFYPASVIAEWSCIAVEEFQQLEGIEYIECNSIREEALVVLFKADEMLNATGQDVAIVANDKRLIKCILSLAPLFKTPIRNCHEIPFVESNSVTFLKLVFQAASDNFPPTSLLSLFKHESFSFKDECIFQVLENKYFRGICKHEGLDELIDLVCEPSVKTFLKGLRSKFLPLTALLSKENISFQTMLQALVDVAIGVGTVKICKILELPFGENLISPQEFLSAFSAVLAPFKQIQAETEKCKIQLLPFEGCSLCSCSNIIFTGLNETAGQESNITQTVSEIVGVVSHAQSEVEQSRHLFYFMHRPRVLLTRSILIAGVPQLQSRWLARLKLFEKKFKFNLKADYLSKKVSELYIPLEFVNYSPPNPAPQITPRLTKLSVTQVELLTKNPYSLYAQCLLKLKPLQGIDRILNQADFGRFVHSVINEFAKTYDDSLSDQEQLHFITLLSERAILSMTHKNNASTLWLMRFHKIAKWIIDFEKKRGGKKVYTETRGSVVLSMDCGEFNLTCIADRIEIENAQANIIDFKTGALPSNKEIASYMAPQLPLTALILLDRGFDFCDVVELRDLTYIQLGCSVCGKFMNIKGDLNIIVEEARRGLTALINFYNKPGIAFKSLAGTNSWQGYNNYMHLERVKELA